MQHLFVKIYSWVDNVVITIEWHLPTSTHQVEDCEEFFKSVGHGSDTMWWTLASQRLITSHFESRVCRYTIKCVEYQKTETYNGLSACREDLPILLIIDLSLTL